MMTLKTSHTASKYEYKFWVLAQSWYCQIDSYPSIKTTIFSVDVTLTTYFVFNIQPFSKTGEINELCFEYLS